MSLTDRQMDRRARQRRDSVHAGAGGCGGSAGEAAPTRAPTAPPTRAPTAPPTRAPARRTTRRPRPGRRPRRRPSKYRHDHRASAAAGRGGPGARAVAGPGLSRQTVTLATDTAAGWADGRPLLVIVEDAVAPGEPFAWVRAEERRADAVIVVRWLRSCDRLQVVSIPATWCSTPAASRSPSSSALWPRRGRGRRAQRLRARPVRHRDARPRRRRGARRCARSRRAAPRRPGGTGGRGSRAGRGRSCSTPTTWSPSFARGPGRSGDGQWVLTDDDAGRIRRQQAYLAVAVAAAPPLAGGDPPPRRRARRPRRHRGPRPRRSWGSSRGCGAPGTSTWPPSRSRTSALTASSARPSCSGRSRRCAGRCSPRRRRRAGRARLCGPRHQPRRRRRDDGPARRLRQLPPPDASRHLGARSS